MLEPPPREKVSAIVGETVELLIVDAGSVTFVLSGEASIVGQDEVVIVKDANRYTIFPETESGVRLNELINQTVNDILFNDDKCILVLSDTKVEFHTNEFYEGYSVSVGGVEYNV